MKAKVTEDCTGCELCTTICPEGFEMGDDGLAHPIGDSIPAGSEDTAKEAAETCPVEAIILEG